MIFSGHGKCNTLSAFKRGIANINISDQSLKYIELFLQKTKKLRSKFELDRKYLLEIIELYHHICNLYGVGFSLHHQCFRAVIFFGNFFRYFPHPTRNWRFYRRAEEW